MSSCAPITTTRLFASGPNHSRNRLGNSVATSMPVKPQPTTATVLRAGDSGSFASVAKCASSATASSMQSTENACSASPGTGGLLSLLPLVSNSRSYAIWRFSPSAQATPTVFSRTSISSTLPSRNFTPTASSSGSSGAAMCCGPLSYNRGRICNSGFGETSVISTSLPVTPAASSTRAAPSAPHTPAKPAPTIRIFCDMIIALG